MGVVALLMIQGPDPAGGLPAMAFVIIQTAAAVLISIIDIALIQPTVTLLVSFLLCLTLLASLVPRLPPARVDEIFCSPTHMQGGSLGMS